MKGESAFSLIWLVFVIIGIILKAKSPKNKKEQPKKPQQRNAPDYARAAAEKFAKVSGEIVSQAPPAPEARPVPEEAPEPNEALRARSDFASMFEPAVPAPAAPAVPVPPTPAAPVPQASGSMEYDSTEGEEENEHLEHLRKAEEARERDMPKPKKPRFDRAKVRSAFIASEVLGRPVSMR